MRCLYCGNELALLKKLTGYGEFCSEAHRQKYQEQYNRLALSRLLQVPDVEERRPLSLPQSRIRGGHSALEPGRIAKQLESARRSSPDFDASPPPTEDPPDLRGFLPHAFEPALSPSELFSSDPFLSPVTACLPDSHGRVAALSNNPSLEGNSPPPPNGTAPSPPTTAAGARWTILERTQPLNLSLARIPATPIVADSPWHFGFPAAYEHTIGELLSLVLDEQPVPPLMPSLNGTGNGHSLNGHGTAAAFEFETPAEMKVEPGETRPENEAEPASEIEEPVKVAQGSIEPDADLFEPAASPADAAGPPEREPSGRPPVVINFAALGLLDPDTVESPARAAVEPPPAEPPVHLPGTCDAHVEEAPVKLAPAETPDTAVSPVVAPRPAAEESVPAEAPPADTLSSIQAASVPVILKAAAEPIPQVVPEPIRLPARRIIATLDRSRADRPEPPAPPVQVPQPPEEAMPVEPAPVVERIPVLCSEHVRVELALAHDAFRPIDDAEFAVPVFDIQTPEATVCPLRPKLVFGPTPAVPDSPAQETASVEHTLAGTAEAEAEPGVEAAAEREHQLVTSPPEAPPQVTAEPPVEPDRAAVKPDPATARGPRSRRSMATLTRQMTEEATAHPQAPPAPAAPAPAAQPALPPPVADRATDLESLRMELEQQAAPPVTPVRSRRIAVAIALILAILIAGYLLRQAFASGSSGPDSSGRIQAFGPSLIAGEGGWSAELPGSLGGNLASRQVYIFRPSMTMSDYRFEFVGQIESKGLGWVFRAVNARNYYALKLETSGGGLVLSRAAIINGEETQKAEIPLPRAVPGEKGYKVQTDVLGSTFRTYINDDLADTWSDDRLRIGGVGLLKDAGELAQVRLIQLHGLRVTD